ncbi:MAG: PAS domain-containing hybrid sensor histidine kinase/response regulator [Gemmatimonadaceae bacterium]
MKAPLEILLIEDNADDAELVARELRRAGLTCRLRRAWSVPQLRAALAERRWDLVLCDYSLPGFSGTDALGMVREVDAEVPFIFVSGTIGEAAAVAAMRGGAQDYVLKGDLVRLAPAIERELREAQARADRLRAEAALEASEQRLRRIYDAEVFGMFLWDATGEIADANDYFLRLLGYDQADLASGLIHWRELTPAEYLEQDIRAGRQVLSEGRAAPYEKEFFHAKGHRVPVVIAASMLDNEPGCGCALVVDLSNLRRAESEAQEASRLVSAMLLTTPLPIILLDADGTVRLWNAAAEQVFGWRDVDVIGDRLPFTARTDDGVTLDVADRVLEGRPLRGVELVSAKRDGTPLLLELHCAPTSDKYGLSRGVALVFRDVTESRATEEALRHAQRVQTIGQLAGGIAHDFNNLLTIIASSIELALAEAGPDDPRRTDLQTARDAAQRGAGLTRQLLNFRRQQVAVRMPVDINAVVSPMQQMLQRSLGNPDIRVEVTLGSRHGVVRADAGQIEQVLLNLAVNARDAMSTGGVLSISTFDDRVPESTFDNHASANLVDAVGIEVRDTGSGMTQETIARAFDPFFTTKPPGYGTGLGLSTVREIMHVNGGAIALKSAEGSGTTFTLLFRRTDAGQVMPQGSVPGGLRLPADIRILLVDDESIIRRVTKLLLERHGGIVTEVSSGDEAIAHLSAVASPPTILVTDVSMPGMSGVDLAATIRTRYPALPVLYLSGYTDDERIEAELRRGDCRFLQKPFRADEIIATITDMVRN